MTTHSMPAAQSSNALPANTRLEEYVIQSVLGIGGFGITYLARDNRLGSLVALKEYFPHAYAQSDHTHTIDLSVAAFVTLYRAIEVTRSLRAAQTVNQPKLH